MTEEAAPVETTDSAPVDADWRASLPDDLRSNPTIADVPDVATLAKRLVDTKAMVGKRKPIPTDDAAPEEIGKFVDELLGYNHLPIMKRPDKEDGESVAELYRTLGVVPEEPSGYEAVEGIEPEVMGAIAAKAHERGIPAEILQATLADIAEIDMGVREKAKTEYTEAMDRLKGEWGNAFDERTGVVGEFLNQFMPHLTVDKLNANDISGFYAVAKQFGGENAFVAKQSSQPPAMTPDELRQRIDEIGADLITHNYDSTTTKRMQAQRLEYAKQLTATN